MTLTGTSVAVAASYGSSGITGFGNEYVELSGTTASASELNAINAGTTGTVNMASVLTVTGALADLTTMYNTAGFGGRGNEAVTLTDTSVAASFLNSLDTRTTGVIDASSVTMLTGTSTQVSASFASAGITGLGNAAIDVTGGAGAETITGTSWNDIIDGAGGADILTGGLGSDDFIFVAGQANGDTVLDYSGLTGQNDQLIFEGYGAGATFIDLGDGLYEIANASRTIVDVITVNGYGSGISHEFII
jgi:Ca2+-binding RTX toxin-like protein